MVQLEKRFFTEREEEILRYGDLSVSLFTYDSGVHGVHLKNDRGYITALRYMGQQIWDAFFDGRRLTMKSPVRMIRY